MVKLKLPKQIRRPGTYDLTWVARSGTEAIRRTLKLTLVGPKRAQVKPPRLELEIVLAGGHAVMIFPEGSRASSLPPLALPLAEC